MCVVQELSLIKWLDNTTASEDGACCLKSCVQMIVEQKICPTWCVLYMAHSVLYVLSVIYMNCQQGAGIPVNVSSHEGSLFACLSVSIAHRKHRRATYRQFRGVTLLEECAGRNGWLANQGSGNERTLKFACGNLQRRMNIMIMQINETAVTQDICPWSINLERNYVRSSYLVGGWARTRPFKQTVSQTEKCVFG